MAGLGLAGIRAMPSAVGNPNLQPHGVEILMQTGHGLWAHRLDFAQVSGTQGNSVIRIDTLYKEASRRIRDGAE